ncbi:MAG: 3-deoxy-7-phosphoheptulonate synthase [Bacteroidetes bacterium]|nr:MAG: 3-deoxy-7-phosphoheptulonate synthase [Bacteroidota bacterium]
MSYPLTEHIRKEKRPFVIAGPCSAESEEQMQVIAADLARDSKVKLLRAGIWKPRTRPDSFSGIGQAGLKWLVDAGRQNGLPVCTEVANREHVEDALKAGVDVLWIGARTSVNPFTVQEIADVLRGVEIPVMVKNPINPDLNLWIGALERLEKSGIKELTAIHRGFSIYQHRKYRNVPNWELPIALKERFQELPLICDPSHIGGKRSLLREISQKAMDLNFDGLMIETHPSPEQALSDAEQQITADELNDLLSHLVLRSAEIRAGHAETIDDLREKIAILDDRVFELLSARMDISSELGHFKRDHHITILQTEHWKNMIDSRLNKSADYGLTRRFIRQVMDAIHQESIRRQTKIMNEKEDQKR